MNKEKSTEWMRKLSYNLSELSQPWRGAAADEYVDGYELACEAFGLSMHSHDESGLKCFAYLWRRFGKPSGIGDEYKDLCVYHLGTPLPDVAIRISPRGSGLAYGIGYYAGDETMQQLSARANVWWEQFTELTHNAKRAYGCVFEASLDKEFWAEACKKLGSPREPRDWKKGSDIRKEVNEAILTALKELLKPVFIRDVTINILGRVDAPDN